LLEKAVDQLQDAPVADRLAYPCHKPVVRDRIEGSGHRLPITMIFRIR